MIINLSLSQDQFCLPNIELIETEQAFADAFLTAAQVLHQQLEQIKSTVKVPESFPKKHFDLAILGLFSKMNRHYYSYILLEFHHDQIGSQFLIEHLREAAITLIYLLEEVDKSYFPKYVSASVHQASYLLSAVEEQLQEFPNQPDLLSLKDELDNFIIKHQNYAVRPLTVCSTYLWGAPQSDATDKRSIIGLNFLTNPARQIALRVMPASWLETQLSYSNNSGTQGQTGINFTNLRNAAHLCLHAAQIFLEEINNHQGANFSDLRRQQQSLNVLYEWFYKAHYMVSELHCVDS